MPLIDMQIKDLERYTGVNPRPADFDEYWNNSIAEMKAIDPQVVMKKAEFQSPVVECYDMYFTGVNGARIHVKHLRPRKITDKIPAVLQFHGYSSDCGNWYEKLGYAASGFAVFAMDVRGQAGKSQDSGGSRINTFHGHVIRGLEDKDSKKLFYRDVFLDVAELASIIMEMDFIDKDKVYATGCSQGGALTLACAALEPRVAKAAPVVHSPVSS